MQIFVFADICFKEGDQQRMDTKPYRSMPFMAYRVMLMSMILAGGLLFIPTRALGQITNKGLHALSSCPAVGAITPQSLLVVLLDRSGSLTYQPGATDPDGYSTSVTKALADLWPGSMAVIPFSNNTTPVIGTVPLTDLSKRDSLKQQVENYPIGGDTPLAPAMHKALDLLEHASSGSRAIIVTDGSPDPAAINGVDQAGDIRSNLIAQFCRQGTPITAFGLALDLNSADGQSADHLLRDIASGTGGTYTNVRNSTELAQVVIKLYADWQHLTFTSTQGKNNNYVIPIDTYAKKVTFVTFRANSSSPIVLKGPNMLPVPAQALQSTIDRHYEIDNLVLSDVNQPGSYTIVAPNDANTHVYALVETRLHAVLKQPATQDIAYIGQPFAIQAELLKDNIPVVPKLNEATINAEVTLLVNGQIVSQETVELMQENNGPLFTHQVTLAGPSGQVHIQIEAVYTQLPVEASEAQVTFSLEKPAVVPVRQKPELQLVCGINLMCYVQHYPVPALGIPFALLLLLLLLFWTRQTGPYGSLIQGRHVEVLSSLRRPFFRVLFHKSRLNARELEHYGDFEFAEAAFDLQFSKNGVYLRAQKDTPQVAVKKKSSIQKMSSKNRDGIELQGNDAIVVEHSTPAIYKEDENI
jgi:von Willebrand factor type A domain